VSERSEGAGTVGIKRKRGKKGDIIACWPGKCVLAGRSYHSFGQMPGRRSGTAENHHEKTKQCPQEKILAMVI